MPQFTIVIPCFNAEATLEETLDSLLAQSDTGWEALIVDDGSTDGSRSIAAAYARRDARFRVLANPGKGPSDARNLAITEAEGELLAFCDADDLWAPHKLACMRTAFADPSADAVFARVAFFDGSRTRSLSSVPKEPLSIPVLLGENPVCTLSNLAVRHEVFAATGGFDAGLVHNEDLEWLIRLAGHGGRIIGVDETLVFYRTSPTGLSADLAAMRRGRAAAAATAARYGHAPCQRAEAVYLRYLARRALRTGAPGSEALRLALAGAAASPAGFFGNPRRGGLTLAGALAAPLMPRRLRRALFAT